MYSLVFFFGLVSEFLDTQFIHLQIPDISCDCVQTEKKNSIQMKLIFLQLKKLSRELACV